MEEEDAKGHTVEANPLAFIDLGKGPEKRTASLFLVFI